MNILLSEAVLLSKKFPDLPIIFLNNLNFTTSDGQEVNIKAASRFSEDYTTSFEAAGINTVSIIYTDVLYSRLNLIDPVKYRKPYAKKSFIDVDKLLTEYKDINRRSKRQRYIISLTEQYIKNKAGKIVPVLKYGENITYERWQEIKPKIDKKKPLGIRVSENGIIVFVDLRQGGADYLKRFMKNSDLVTLLVGRKSTDKILISPDFIGGTDVMSVDDPQKLLPEYADGNWKLIIVGDTLSKKYAEALSLVKNYDKYARFMMATNIDIRKKEEFITSVKNAYNYDNWEE